jgi:hypothetical protein
VGCNSWEYIFMKKNIEFKVAFQIHSNWTCRYKLFYTMECVQLSKKKLRWRFEKVQKQRVGMVRGLYP